MLHRPTARVALRFRRATSPQPILQDPSAAHPRPFAFSGLWQAGAAVAHCTVYAHNEGSQKCELDHMTIFVDH